MKTKYAICITVGPVPAASPDDARNTVVIIELDPDAPHLTGIDLPELLVAQVRDQVYDLFPEARPADV